jgi:phosphatidylinositol-3-phosphatase
MSHFKKAFSMIALLLLAACGSGGVQNNPSAESRVPKFDHIVMIMLENEDFDKVIGNSDMPNFNKLANENVLLTKYDAVTHPSLPNYIALIGGDTFGIKDDCTDCFINAPSLPDLIEASGRTWKTYQEDIPSPCFVGDAGDYVQKHDPFIYFDPIRLDKARCENSVVSFDALKSDIAADALPNFIFITPNMCHNSHDCSLGVADDWLEEQLNTLIPALEKDGSNYLVVVMFEEGANDSFFGDRAGGRVPVILLSPQAKNNFQDDTPYSHYSLLKTISNAWGLSYLGHVADENTKVINEPWK